MLRFLSLFDFRPIKVAEPRKSECSILLLPGTLAVQFTSLKGPNPQGGLCSHPKVEANPNSNQDLAERRESRG